MSKDKGGKNIKKPKKVQPKSTAAATKTEPVKILNTKDSKP
jgi:hypothetical protein